jgi:hypothetical protein
VIEWAPAERAEVENVALPPLKVPLPIVVAPSRNVTDPVAVDGETEAVKVTNWPYFDGFKLVARLVVVFVLLPPFTVWETTFEVLALLDASPP